MATINPSITPLSTFGNTECNVVVWTPMTQTGSDVGSPFENPGQADRSIQVTGTVGAGGNLRIEGSNDGSTWATLTDPQGNALDFTSAKIEQVSEITRYIRPRVTAGDGTTSFTVTMLARRGYR